MRSNGLVVGWFYCCLRGSKIVFSELNFCVIGKNEIDLLILLPLEPLCMSIGNEMLQSSRSFSVYPSSYGIIFSFLSPFRLMFK